MNIHYILSLRLLYVLNFIIEVTAFSSYGDNKCIKTNVGKHSIVTFECSED